LNFSRELLGLLTLLPTDDVEVNPGPIAYSSPHLTRFTNKTFYSTRSIFGLC